MSKLANMHTLTEVEVSANLFHDLIESIIGQQLSNKVAPIIIKRFVSLIGENYQSPDIVKNSDDVYRSLGLSYRKASYIRSLSEEIINGRLVLDSLTSLENESVIGELTKVRGIGRWTAEMFLIFSLARPDVFSLGDLGLRTAVSRLYGVDREDINSIENISQNWTPFRSSASRLLWRSLD